MENNLEYVGETLILLGEHFLYINCFWEDIQLDVMSSVLSLN